MTDYSLPIALLGALLILIVLPGMLELFWLTLGASLFRTRRQPVAPSRRPLRFCVVMPAHDEEDGIARTVGSVLAARRGPHAVSLVVVADNCRDATAGMARAAGARVLERQDPEHRGKGYALDYAFRQLMPEAHEVFVVIDADTSIEPHFFEALAACFEAGAAGVQCAYRASNPEASVRARLMHIAWLAFNVLRLRGRETWGQSVGLNGNGFALTRGALEAVPYEAGSIAEDLEYHLRFVESGRRLVFCDQTTVWSPVPAGGKGAATQRSRWEGGRLRMMREQLPRLLARVCRGRFDCLEPLLELTLLPLGYHVLLLVVLACLPWPPAQWVGGLGLLGVIWHVLLALRLGGSFWRDAAALWSAPFYVLWKLSLVRRLLASSGREAVWERTERD